MSGRYGPGRGEHLFRLAFSLAGLALLGVAVWYRGVSGLASIEIGIFGGGFLAGSALWSGWNVWKRQ